MESMEKAKKIRRVGRFDKLVHRCIILGIGTRVYQRKHPKERWPEETSQAAKRIEIQRSSRFVFGNRKAVVNNRKAVVNNRKAAKDSRKITEK